MKRDLPNELLHPIDVPTVLRKRRSLKRKLLEQPNIVPTRIAILGGRAKTAEVTNMLELFLLTRGIQATLYESKYNRYSEDVLFENPELLEGEADVEQRVSKWGRTCKFLSLGQIL
jgi:hypothetical protein